MPIYTFRVSWEDDDSVQRDIEIQSAQSFMEFHTCIKQAYAIKDTTEGSFYISDDFWSKGKEINSTIEKNIKNAPSLSCARTPIGALVLEPHQRFVYVSAVVKNWQFLIELIEINKEDGSTKNLPIILKSEGMSPEEIGKHNKGKKGNKNSKDIIVEIEEKYDLDNHDGFGDEGEEGDESSVDSDDNDEEDSNEMFNPDEELY